MRRTKSKPSKREQEVLNHFVNGETVKEIADTLSISPTTVISHRNNLVNKFQAKNTTHLCCLAIRIRPSKYVLLN